MLQDWGKSLPFVKILGSLVIITTFGKDRLLFKEHASYTFVCSLQMVLAPSGLKAPGELRPYLTQI
jgi:hypothetical protein